MLKTLNNIELEKLIQSGMAKLKWSDKMNFIHDLESIGAITNARATKLSNQKENVTKTLKEAKKAISRIRWCELYTKIEAYELIQKLDALHKKGILEEKFKSTLNESKNFSTNQVDIFHIECIFEIIFQYSYTIFELNQKQRTN